MYLNSKLVELSYHSKERAKERLGYSQKTLFKMFSIAYRTPEKKFFNGSKIQIFFEKYYICV
jgi:hypothetical protein